eukprot:s551_g6.t1
MVSRDLLIQSLSAHQVPGILINAVQQLHRDARYIFRTATQSGSVTTTNGIKQGCRAAPTLWVSLTVLILEHLIQFRSLSWVQRILTLFADDFCGYWTLRSTHDFEQFIQDLTLLVETLELFQLKINLQKTALLLHLKGKGARKLLEKYTIHKAAETFLRLPVHGTDRLIRIKDSHIYLGAVIAYHNRKDLNIRHRINAAQARYQPIRKVLSARGPISTRHRLRLWNACIPPCLLYSLEATGCTSRGLIRLRVLATRHLRAILRKPAHLSRISNSDIWSQARLDPPELSLRHRLVHLCQRRDPAIAEHCPDLVSNESVVKQLTALLTHLEGLISTLRSHETDSAGDHQATDPFPCEHCGKQLTALLTHLEGLISTLRSHETDSAGDHQATDPFPCEHCGLTFTTAHARLIHHSIKHAELDPPQDGRQKVIFSAPSHAVAGMPTCKLCGRNFPKWQQLRLHIEHGSCPALGGASHNLSPIPASNSAMSQPAHAGLPSAQPAQSPAATIASAPSERPEQKAAEMQVPLICQQSFKNSLHCWDKLLDDRLFRNRLRSYCTYFSALSCTSCALLYLSANLPPAGSTMDSDLSSEIFAHCMPSGAQLLSTFQEEGTLPQKRQHPEQGRTHGRMPGRMHQHRPAFSTYSAHHPQSPPPFGTPLSQRENHIRLLSKIVLKQEEQLALLRKDTQFVLFMRQDDKSILPENHIRLLSKIVLKQEEQLALLRKDTQFVLFMRQDDKSILPALMLAAKEWKTRQETTEGQTPPSSQRTVLLSCLLRELLARVQRIVATEQGRESLKKADWLRNDTAWTYLRWAPKQKRLVVSSLETS